MSLLLLLITGDEIIVVPPVLRAGTTDVVDISNALKNKLSGVGKLSDVYDYERDKPIGGRYPFATITLKSLESDFGDTMRNLRRYEYSVRVYQERTESGFGNQKSERIMREALNEIKVALNADITLSGTVKWIKPFSGNAQFVERELGETRMVEFVVEATNVTPIHFVDASTPIEGDITQTAISNAIKTKLEGAGALNGVYEYEPDKPTSGQYPFATITVDTLDGDFGSTGRNIQKQNYTVKLYQERTETGFGNEKAERVVRQTIDEVITAFDKDPTLSGLVKYIRPVGGTMDYIDREIGETRIAEINLECNTLVNS